MVLKIRKIHLDEIIYLCVIFAATMPYGLSIYFGRIYNFLNSYLCLFSFLAIFLLIFRNGMKFKMYKVTLIVAIFRMLIIVNSLMREGNSAAVSENIRYCLLIVSVCACAEFAINCKRMNAFINAVLLLYTVYLIINTGLSIIYPDGLIVRRLYTTNGLAYRDVSYAFIGFRNYFSFYFIPVLGFIYISKLEKNKSFIILQGLIVLNVFMEKSTTSIITIVIFYLVIWLSHLCKYARFKGKRIEITNKKIFLVYIVVFSTVVLFNGGERIRGLVAGLFGKNASLTGRTTVWELAKDSILMCPIFGYGNDDIIYMNGFYWYAHNGVFDLMIQGGMILLFVYLSLLIFCYKKLEKYKKSDIYFVSTAVTASFAIMMLVESCVNYSILFYAILAFFGNVSKVLEPEGLVEKRKF